MFIFETRPDPCLIEIINAAMDISIDYIRTWLNDEMEKEDGIWVQDYLRGGLESLNDPAVTNKEHEWLQCFFGNDLEKMFSPKELIAELTKLRSANKDNKYYHLKEYHLLIIYTTLERYIEIHNDMVNIDMTPLPIGKTQAGLIEFDDIIEIYYSDIDFLLQEEVFGSDVLKEVMGVSSSALGPVSGFKPHPDELFLEEATKDEIDDMEYPNEKIYTRNMDYPCYDDLDDDEDFDNQN